MERRNAKAHVSGARTRDANSYPPNSTETEGNTQGSSKTEVQGPKCKWKRGDRHTERLCDTELRSRSIPTGKRAEAENERPEPPKEQQQTADLPEA